MKLALTALCFAGLAAGQTNLFTQDPLSCFAMSGEPASDLTIVPVTGMSFSKAMHVKTGPVSATANAWDIRPRCFNTGGAKSGDTALATFWMRTVTAPNGTGLTSFVIEQNVSPYTKSTTYTVGAGTDWKKVEIPFTMAQTYTTGNDGYNVSFWVTFPNQEIEIGGITMVNYGAGVTYSSLPLTTWPYDGHDPNASWRAAAAARIEKIRKGDIAIAVRDAAGNPVPAAAVHVKMKRHAFGFGTAVAAAPIQDSGSDGQKYREALGRLFNKAVFENALKWQPYEAPGGKQQAEAIFSWLKANNMTLVRGHNIIWPSRTYLPGDVVNMLNASPVDTTALRDRIDRHFADVMAFTRGRVTEWDVLNEPVVNTDVQKALGNAEMIHWFQEARQFDPSIKLYINDYDILEAGGYDLAHQDAYYNIIQYILQGGGNIDGIGLQSHFDTNLTPPDRVLQLLDRFAAFGKDLQVTEYDVTLNDEQLQADYTSDFLTACFSHASVKGFMIWGFWAGAHWRPQAAMIRKDWSTTPSYDVWNNLIYSKWWTDVTGTTGPDGIFRTRGFLGDYDIEVTTAGNTTTYPLQVASNASPNYLRTGTIPTAAVTPAGIVNAATYQSGPIAPGKAVAVFGQNFGPAQLAVANPGDIVAGDTRILFDGVPAQMIYSWAGQAAAIVPPVANPQTQLQVEFLGVPGDAVPLQTAPSAPGIYCYSGGTGPAAAYLSAPGFLTFFLTGDGGATPAVSIGGQPSTCLGNWSGLISPGVLQINACIPNGLAGGQTVALQAVTRGLSSQPGVTFTLP